MAPLGRRFYCVDYLLELITADVITGHNISCSTISAIGVDPTIGVAVRRKAFKGHAPHPPPF